MLRVPRSSEQRFDPLIKLFSTTHWTQISYFRPPLGLCKPDRTVSVPGKLLPQRSVQTKHISKAGPCHMHMHQHTPHTNTHIHDCLCAWLWIRGHISTAALTQNVGKKKKSSILCEHWVHPSSSVITLDTHTHTHIKRHTMYLHINTHEHKARNWLP